MAIHLMLTIRCGVLLNLCKTFNIFTQLIWIWFYCVFCVLKYSVFDHQCNKYLLWELRIHVSNGNSISCLERKIKCNETNSQNRIFDPLEIFAVNLLATHHEYCPSIASSICSSQWNKKFNGKITGTITTVFGTTMLAIARDLGTNYFGNLFRRSFG